jgi:hypothetical protein
MASVTVDVTDVQKRYEGDLSRFPDGFVETQISDAVD